MGKEKFFRGDEACSLGYEAVVQGKENNSLGSQAASLGWEKFFQGKAVTIWVEKTFLKAGK